MQTDIFRSFHFSFEEVQPANDEILSFLKSESAEDDYPVNAAIREIMPALSDNNDIRGGYIIKNADKVSLNFGVQVGKYMKKAGYFALFVCTAGPRFTGLVNRYNASGSYLEAYVADAIGSLTVEKAMDKIQAQLELELQAEELKISNRYSPGYCNWSVSGQRELFDQMGELPVAVSLTESCLMLPMKSVSGIIGIGAHIHQYSYACRTCKDKDCIYRKIIQ